MIKNLGLVGMGPMGTAIAKLAALKHIEVLMYDVNETLLRRSLERIKNELRHSVQKNEMSAEESLAVIDRLKTRTSLTDLGHCDIIIEAVVEDIRVKKDLFKHLDINSKASALLVSTTKALPISAIGSLTKNTGRVIGIHFFDPIESSQAVEIIPNITTPMPILHPLIELVTLFDKKPFIVHDTPGAVVERGLQSIYQEALFLKAENIALPEQIDKLLAKNVGPALEVFRKMDETGLDAILESVQTMYHASFEDPRYKPHPMLRKMIDAGLTGKKSGKGFYQYLETNE